MQTTTKTDFEVLLNIDEYVREKIPGVFTIAHALWHKENKLPPIWEIIIGCVPISFFEKVLSVHFQDIAREHKREIKMAMIEGPKGCSVQVRFFPSTADSTQIERQEWGYGFPDYASFMDGGEIVQIIDTQIARLTGTVARHPLPPEREAVIFRDGSNEVKDAGNDTK